MELDAQQDHDPVRFVPLHFDESARWHRPASLSFVGRLDRLLLSDTEVLQTSHHLPVAIESFDGRLQVVAITSPQFQRTPLVDAEGRWRRGYTPMALRCLPFRAVDNPHAQEILEVAIDLPGSNGNTLSVLRDDGTPVHEIRQIASLLRRLETGRRKLQAAAEKLLLADVLAPFQLARLQDKTTIRPNILTVDRNKFAALSNRRAAHIAKDDFLAIDLAAACLFSQRLVPGPISVAAENARPAVGIESEPAVPLKSNALLDDSELFSFELFSGAVPAR